MFRKKRRVRRRRPSRHYRKNKEAARAIIIEKVRKYNYVFQYPLGRVSIRNQKSRWGSCSKKGNLNFNYKIMFLREEIADYIVVHELCHLEELNHSQKFWNLVAQVFPNYKQIRNELRRKVVDLS